MADKPPFASSSSAPSASDNLWLQHAHVEQQKEPERLEETAKYLAAIIAISLTIFIDQRPPELSNGADSILIIAALLWMASAFLSFLVLFPWRYKYNPDSPDDIRRVFRRVAIVKRFLLILSSVFFLIALGMGVFVFLSGP